MILPFTELYFDICRAHRDSAPYRDFCSFLLSSQHKRPTDTSRCTSARPFNQIPWSSMVSPSRIVLPTIKSVARCFSSSLGSQCCARRDIDVLPNREIMELTPAAWMWLHHIFRRLGLAPSSWNMGYRRAVLPFSDSLAGREQRRYVAPQQNALPLFDGHILFFFWVHFKCEPPSH